MSFFRKHVHGEHAMIKKAFIRILAVTSLLTVLVLFRLTYKTTHFLSPSPFTGTSSDESDGDGWPPPADKVVVVPKMSYEDTDWLGPDLPE